MTTLTFKKTWQFLHLDPKPSVIFLGGGSLTVLTLPRHNLFSSFTITFTAFLFHHYNAYITSHANMLLPLSWKGHSEVVKHDCDEFQRFPSPLHHLPLCSLSHYRLLCQIVSSNSCNVTFFRALVNGFNVM